MQRRLIVILITTAALSAVLSSTALAYKAKVLQVTDGDTIIVTYKGKKRPLHLSQIDCPQMEQPYGKQAAEFTRSQVEGKVVEVEPGGALLAKDIRTPEGRSLSYLLIRKGLAWYPENYSRRDPLVLNADDGLANLERRVRRKRLGLWSQAKPKAPWVIHKNRESTMQIANLPNVRIGVG